MAFRDLVGGLLGAPESKAALVGNQPYPVVSPTLARSPQWSEWDSEKAIREGLKASVYVYRGVTMNAKAASSVPWRAYMKPRSRGAKREPVEGHDLERILAKPMTGLDIRPRKNGADLFEALYGYLFLSGKAGIYLDGLRRDGRFANMRVMMPHRMYPVLEPKRGIVQWEYHVDGTPYPVPVEAVWYTRFPDPASEWDGLSPLMAMARLVDTDVESVNHNWWTLKNQAVVAGALVHKGHIPEPEKQANKREWQASYGGKKRGATPILSGDEWSYIQMGMSPQQLLLIEQRQQTALEIALGLGIPPELMGLQKTYANFGQARKAWWEDTLVPMVDDIKTAINDELAPRWDDRLEIEPDYSNIPALQEDRDAREKRIIARVAGGVMKVNRAQEELGMESDPNANVYLTPYSAVPAPDYKRALETEPKRAVVPERKAIDPVTEEGRLAYWLTWDAMLRRMGGALGSQVYQELIQEQEELLQAFQADAAPADWEARVDQVMADSRPRLVAMLTGAGLATVQQFGQPVFDALVAQGGSGSTPASGNQTPPPSFDPYDQAIRDYLARHTAEHVRLIEATTAEAVRSSIRDVIAQGWDDGQTILEMAARIAKLPEMDIARGETIAVTETTALANYGALAAAAQSGVKVKKRWLSARDSRVRDTHQPGRGADGQTKELHEPFRVGASLLMHPGDTSLGAQAKETVRCRCTVVFDVQTDDEE